MTPATVIHIRHGETDWNAARRLQGAQDIPLNDTGRAQAARNGTRLAELFADLGRPPEAFDWVASPLGRTRETMEIVRRTIGLPVSDYRIEPRLKEISFGRLEGSTYEEVAVEDPESYAGLRADKWHFVPPGGENYVMLTTRVRAALADMPRDVVIVSHGGVFRALLGILRDAGPAEWPELSELTVPQETFFVRQNGTERWL